MFVREVAVALLAGNEKNLGVLRKGGGGRSRVDRAAILTSLRLLNMEYLRYLSSRERCVQQWLLSKGSDGSPRAWVAFQFAS